MSVLIWDNGRPYSDHSISFYDCEGWFVDDVEGLAELLRGGDPDGMILGIVWEMTWREKWNLCSGSEALDCRCLLDLKLEERHISVLRRNEEFIKKQLTEDIEEYKEDLENCCKENRHSGKYIERIKDRLEKTYKLQSDLNRLLK